MSEAKQEAGHKHYDDVEEDEGDAKRYGFFWVRWFLEAVFFEAGFSELYKECKYGDAYGIDDEICYDGNEEGWEGEVGQDEVVGLPGSENNEE